MKRAFTLVEICVVLVIVAILAGLIAPALRSGLLASKKTSTSNKLRQLYYATTIYREEHNGGGKFGDLAAMGLPSAMYVYFDRFKLPKESIESSCGAHPYWASSIGDNKVPQIYYFPGEGGREFEAAAQKWGERLVLYFDVQCNDPSINISNPFTKKFGLGILFDGSLVRPYQDGDCMQPKFWSTPSEGG